MEQPVSRATIINLEHFPVYRKPKGAKDGVSHITKFLKKLLSSASYQYCASIELPALGTLARFFHCTYLEIYDALKALRSQGYDFQFSNLEEHVIVWKIYFKSGEVL